MQRRLECDRLQRWSSTDGERGDSASSRSASGARASSENVTFPGTTLMPPGSTSRRPTVATAPSTRARHRGCRARARRHGRARRRGRPSASSPHATARPTTVGLAADVADDPGRDAERHPAALEDGALLDVRPRRTRRAAGPPRRAPAADAPALLVAEGDDGERPALRSEPLDRLEPGHDPERAVELAALGHGVEVGAGPDLGSTARSAQTAHEVPGAVDLDLEAGVPHPAGGEVVRFLLAGGSANPVRASAPADQVDPLEPLQHALHGRNRTAR